MNKNVLENEFHFIPYQSIGDLYFNENEKIIKSKIGNIKEKFDNYGNSGKTVLFNDLDNVSVYFDIKNNFSGIHFFKSIKFILNGKLYDINFNNFTKEHLNDISNDFEITSNEEGTDYTSEKLGLDFYFNSENHLDAVLFMSREYYKNEIYN